MPPEDKLQSSPRIGSGGVTPAAMPAFVEKPRPDPIGEIDDPLCDVLALNKAAWKRHCADR